MMKYEELEGRLEVIRNFTMTFRRQLTIGSSVMAEFTGLSEREDYVKFSNSLTNEEFTGNYITSIYCEDAINWMIEAIDSGNIVEYYRKSLAFHSELLEDIIESLND